MNPLIIPENLATAGDIGAFEKILLSYIVDKTRDQLIYGRNDYRILEELGCKNEDIGGLLLN